MPRRALPCLAPHLLMRGLLRNELLHVVTPACWFLAVAEMHVSTAAPRCAQKQLNYSSLVGCVMLASWRCSHQLELSE
jgi:glucose uptake protein GlcU